MPCPDKETKLAKFPLSKASKTCVISPNLWVFLNEMLVSETQASYFSTTHFAKSGQLKSLNHHQMIITLRFLIGKIHFSSWENQITLLLCYKRLMPFLLLPSQQFLIYFSFHIYTFSDINPLQGYTFSEIRMNFTEKKRKEKQSLSHIFPRKN